MDDISYYLPRRVLRGKYICLVKNEPVFGRRNYDHMSIYEHCIEINRGMHKMRFDQNGANIVMDFFFPIGHPHWLESIDAFLAFEKKRSRCAIM